MIEFELEGVEELTKKVSSKYLLGSPLRRFFTKMALFAEGHAKKGTPSDTGRLRADITHKIDATPVPTFAKVYTTVKYGPFVESDTKPHFPPISALMPWAARHGVNVWAVAKSIARRGTKGKKMFEKALESTQPKMREAMSDLSKDIKRTWDR